MARIPFLITAWAIGLTFISGDFATAQTPAVAKKMSAAKKKVLANQSKAANAHLAKQLETIRTVLNKADHDYQGHRAEAVHQITHAIHLLHHGKAHTNPGQHFVGGKHKEPQAVSDAQLKQSIAALQSLVVPPGKHHAQVQAAIHKAITNLNVALKIA